MILPYIHITVCLYCKRLTETETRTNMSVTGWFTRLLGKPLTVKQMIRQSQRAVNRAVRNIERERYNLERQEKQQILEIKKMAQNNQPDVVRIMANDLVRTRAHIKKLTKMKANLQGIGLQLTSLESQQSITQAVYQATIILRGMNRQLNMPRIQAILKEFEKQTQIMDIKEEMVSETVSDAFGHDDDEEAESDEIVSQVLDELGLQIGQQLPEAPQEIKNTSRKAEAVADIGGTDQGTNSVDDELLARLERLRKE